MKYTFTFWFNHAFSWNFQKNLKIFIKNDFFYAWFEKNMYFLQIFLSYGKGIYEQFWLCILWLDYDSYEPLIYYFKCVINFFYKKI